MALAPKCKSFLLILFFGFNLFFLPFLLRLHEYGLPLIKIACTVTVSASARVLRTRTCVCMYVCVCARARDDNICPSRTWTNKYSPAKCFCYESCPVFCHSCIHFDARMSAASRTERAIKETALVQEVCMHTLLAEIGENLLHRLAVSFSHRPTC